MLYLTKISPLNRKGHICGQFPRLRVLTTLTLGTSDTVLGPLHSRPVFNFQTQNLFVTKIYLSYM